MAVIEVTFDPTIWKYQGANGAYNVYADTDGVTAWAFEGFGGGFCRFNLSDGSKVRTGVLFGANDSNSGGPSWFNNPFINNYQAWLSQDTNNHYYFISQFLGNNSPVAGQPQDGGSFYVFKFHVDPAHGSAGSLLDGYDVTDGYVNLMLNVPSGASATSYNYNPNDAVYFNNGGTNYVGVIGNGDNYMVIYNLDTFVIADYYLQPDSGGDFPSFDVQGYNIFVDNDSTCWGTFWDSDGNVKLVPWTPGGSFGTPQYIPQTVHQLPTVTDTLLANIGYISATNSVLLSDDGSGNSDGLYGCGNVAVVSMTTWTQTLYKASDGMFFHSALTPADTQLMDEVYRSTQAILLEAGPGTATQIGGCINFVNPTTLAILDTQNTTVTINSSSPADPIVAGSVRDWTGGDQGVPDDQFPPFTSVSWSPLANKIVTAYGDLQSGLGSAVYIVDVPDPIPSGQSTVTVVTAVPNPGSPTQTITLTATVSGTVSGHPSTGTVTFYDNGVQIGSPINVNGSGVAIYTGEFTVGTHPITATFSGS